MGLLPLRNQKGRPVMPKITNTDLAEKWEALTRIGSILQAKPKFKWNIAKNKSILKVHRDNLTEGLKQDPKLTEYSKERLQVYDKWAVKTVTEVKNPDGPDGSTTKYQVPLENLDAFEAELKQLDKKHRGILDAEKLRISGMPELMAATIETEFHKISMSVVPDSVSANDLATLWELWEDDLDDVDEDVDEEPEPEVPVKKPIKKKKRKC
jgi:hypothetical protein